MKFPGIATPWIILGGVATIAVLLFAGCFGGSTSATVTPQATVIVLPPAETNTSTPPAPATVTPFFTATPEGFFATPISVVNVSELVLVAVDEIVGDNVNDPTDGLRFREGPAYLCSEDEPLCNHYGNLAYANEIFRLIGIDETGEWCHVGIDIDELTDDITFTGDDWLACEFLFPADEESCMLVADFPETVTLQPCRIDNE